METWSENTTTPPPRWRCFVCATILCVAMATGCSQSTSQPVSPPRLLLQAKAALSRSDAAQVEHLVSQIPLSAEQWQAGQSVAGEAFAKEGRSDDALAYYLAAAEDDSTPDGQLALFSVAELYLELGRLAEAEEFYRATLRRQPKNGITNERMAFLLSMTNRRWESLPYFFVLIRGGSASYRELGMAADVSRQIRQPDSLAKWQRQNPREPLVRLAVATDAFSEGEPRARTLLESLVETNPELVSAQAMLGELLLEAVSPGEFMEWHHQLPATADDSADIWFVRGCWARKQSDLQTAADCFWQALDRSAYHRRSYVALAQILTAADDPQARTIANYAELLTALSQTVDKVLTSDGNDRAAVRRVAGLMEDLGRIWECCAWAIVGRTLSPDADWPSEYFQRHSHKLTADLPAIVSERHPLSGRVIAPSGVVSTEFSRLLELERSEADATRSNPSNAEIRFTDTALIDFQYYNADDPETKGVRSFEQTGGGVAIIDFDLDGAPDVFLPQGIEWATGSDQPVDQSALTDKLFRNEFGRKFRDVTGSLPDSGFGQGAAVGDFNNDGFADIYVANVGRNCLYQNMGDGTFSDVSDAAGISDQSWTTSAMVCDLNADGLPDLFDVNYLTGEGVYERICRDRACSPSVFDGAQDRVLVNLGDGRFREFNDATPTVHSKGLGIVAFETEPNRRPVLFIANDQVANYYMKNTAADNSANLELYNEAIVSGLAYNNHGLPMACMGIALEDLDGNNLLDLLVTNFQDEANTLYLQDSPGLFVDASKAAGLEAASIPYTSWGTQALDADLDGWPDLVVANGHVDDGTVAGRDYQMRPQFFQNLGGRFEELTAEQVGPWFAEKLLGRGLARVDWTLDGRPDFIVSNINSAVSVLRNDSKSAGHFLRLDLKATQTARDAIGAIATLQVGDHMISKQLTAGDGYMASNERVIEFGLGKSIDIKHVTVQWPSGAVSVLELPPVDSTLFVVEGHTKATSCKSQVVESFSVTSTTDAIQ